MEGHGLVVKTSDFLTVKNDGVTGLWKHIREHHSLPVKSRQNGSVFIGIGSLLATGTPDGRMIV